jgi:isopentenyl-diphosphate delta-isomerase
VHDALPSWPDELSTEVTLLGKRLRAPLLITGMTGGTADATVINRDLAAVAEAHGIAFGLGSQRAMQREPALAATFEVRAHAPTTLVLANLGVVQAAQLATSEVEVLVRAISADALCLHLNPAQELIQPGGDRDFRGGLKAIGRLVRELPCPVVVKETGCGISRAVATRLRAPGSDGRCLGRRWHLVVRVEALRGDAAAQALGEDLGVGYPTAAAVLGCGGSASTCIASGGIRRARRGEGDRAGAVAAGVACPSSGPIRRGRREAGAFSSDWWPDSARHVTNGRATWLALGGVPTVLPRLSAWGDFGGGQ